MLVGVSGGRDSVVLLRSLVGAGFRNLVVAHLDHGLRGRASEGDATFVSRLAAAMGLPCVLCATNVGVRALEGKLSVETAAREVRREFFREVAAAERCRLLALGHHGGDRAETVLFNALRGAGLDGLAAMRERSERDGLTVLRPLLGFTREEITAEAKTRGWAFREDRSNASRDAARNRIRHDLIAAASEVVGRDVRPALNRLARIAEADLEALEALTPDAGETVPLRKLAALPLALRRRWVRRWLIGRGVPGVDFDLVERVLAIADPLARSASVNLPGGGRARRRAGALFVGA